MKKISERLIVTSIFFITSLIYLTLEIKCPFKKYLDIPCAGCGMTRALKAVLNLDFKTAFNYHPLFWTTPIIVFLIIFGGKIKGKIEILSWVTIIFLFCVTFLLRIFFKFTV